MGEQINNYEIDVDNLDDARLVISSLMAESQRLKDRLYRDQKTGLLSEEYLNDVVIDKLDESLGIFHSLTKEEQLINPRNLVLLIDMNGLKNINDTRGYDAGDKALISLARALEKTVRDDDYLVRMNKGGDEFILVAKTKNIVSEEAELAITERIKKLIKDESDGSISAAIGCSWLEDNTSFVETRQKAEMAMKADKSAYYDYKQAKAGMFMIDASKRPYMPSGQMIRRRADD